MSQNPQIMAAFFNLPVLLVILSAFLDICANLLLASSNGFKRAKESVLALVLIALAFYCLTFAVKSMDLAVAYALWGSFGILGTSVGGWIFFKQKLKPIAFLGIVLLIIGMLLLKL